MEEIAPVITEEVKITRALPIDSIRNRRIWSGLTKIEKDKLDEFINYLNLLEKKKEPKYQKKITIDKLIYDFTSNVITEWEEIRTKLPPETIEQIKVE